MGVFNIDNKYVNKVIYGGKTIIDLTEDTVKPNKLLYGTTSHQSDGRTIYGTIKNYLDTEDGKFKKDNGYIEIDDNNRMLVEFSPSEEDNYQIFNTTSTYLDRDISIHVKPVQEGHVEIINRTAQVTPQIIENGSKYKIYIDGQAIIRANVDTGYVKEVEPQELLISGQLEIPKTELNLKLIEDSKFDSGYSDLSIIATVGYNGEDLKEHIDIYQGNYNI